MSKGLLSVKGAWFYLAAVFLNAFVDLGHKITIQNTIFKVYDGSTQVILTAVINGIILLPYILLFSPAGFVADRYPKNRVMRMAALGAVVITCGITACYYLGWFWPAFALTFLLAIQSAFYSPAKVGYLRHLFGKERLAAANGMAEATTIVAILSGTFAFSILFESLYIDGSNKSQALLAIAPVGWLLIANSLLELVAAYRLPQLEQDQTQARFDVKDYLKGSALKDNLKPLLTSRVILLSAMGLAIFWSVGQVLLAAFPAFAEQSLAVSNTVVIQGLLASIGVGIAVGSALAGRWSKHHIETGLIPVGAIGIGIGMILLTRLDNTTAHFVNFFLIGIAGGLFIVPLNALIQFNANYQDLGKVLAGNNLIKNLSMFSFLVITALFALAGLESRWLLIAVAVITVFGCLYTISQLPQSLVRIVLSAIMSRRYSIDIQGLNHFPSQGGVLLLGNHISWIDWAIVQIASPRPIRFVMLKSIYQRWYLKGFLRLMGCIPIEQGKGSGDSLATVAKLLDKGEVVCLFPEGLISRNGHLAAFRKGYERACGLTTQPVQIIPFYLRGLWGSQFSRSSEQLKLQGNEGLFRSLIVAFGKPLPKDTPADLLKRRVFDLSIDAWQRHIERLPTVPQAWINRVKREPGKTIIADIATETQLSAATALSACLAFRKRFGAQCRNQQNIGLLLPSSAGGALANMATLLLGKTAVNLNYTASPAAIAAAIEQAEIKTVYTSRQLIKRLQGRGIQLDDCLQNTTVIYLEELRQSIGKAELVRRYLSVRLLPAAVLRWCYCRSNDSSSTAAILFSSGSEGIPKGVRLSHSNIMANIKQIADVLNSDQDDVVMSSLPLFHALGLTVTQFMPLVEGIPMICYADPTDAPSNAKAIAKYRATILFATASFLRLYCKNRNIHPLMLRSLRFVVAGAERVDEQVRNDFQLKFGKAILEGYGATETTPVASVNLPDDIDPGNWRPQIGNKPGTVGMPLPGTSFKIIDPDTEQELGTDEEGMIIIGGNQVMQGYLNNPKKTAEVIREIEGQRWYITGDKGFIDRDGFLTIIDRYSRFAKIAGEMVSLGGVEKLARQAAATLAVDDDVELLAVNVPDTKKGEKIILLCTQAIVLADLKAAMLAAACSPLMLPSDVLDVASIPKLGSGKTDFSEAKKMALAMP